MNAPASPQTNAIVIVPVHKGPVPKGGMRDSYVRLEEAKGLALALELSVPAARLVSIRKAHAGAFLGKGLIDNLRIELHQHDASLLIVDTSLTPVQQRNLEKALDVKVIDRTGLILEIFGLRARTKEGRLQVELALMTYERSRLVRTWTHLERQRGGKGFLAGPGERQLETDRRLLSQRITRLRKALDNVRRTRGLHRSARQRVPYPVIALVGYTNAGKSTLFNALCGTKMLAEDMLFATLDPAMRQIALGQGREAILSDTVGFISDLPTELIAAFRATLEEVLEADLVIHVRDISSNQSAEQREDVNSILDQLFSAQDNAIPILEVWNKIDLVPKEDRALLQAQAKSITPNPVLLSAVSGQGQETLVERIEDILSAGSITVRIAVPAGEGRINPWICRNGKLLDTQSDENGRQILIAQLDSKNLGALVAAFPDISPERVSL
ncbi:MAG: GTPase HflX [Robiginitomaculum sp.]|nr:GTPase HflX [Robiginitomaculum sp.]MDQ7078220.1 GTPase HflX [Robiginitomaculum sp.]